MLSQALGKLFALAEAYPDLKANQNFLQLQDQLSDVENKIAASRRFYNNAVGEYNTGIEQFPANLIAGPFNLKCVISSKPQKAAKRYKPLLRLSFS